jgi:hypothetical protein
MRRLRLISLAAPAILVASFMVTPTASAGLDPGVGNVVQGTQSDSKYMISVSAFGVTNKFVTNQKVSCYRPEVSAAGPVFNDGPNDGYTGESACTGATTGEDIGAAAPYATQQGSNPGSPMSGPQLVKDHSESDLRVDPTNPKHLIGASKWAVSAEGYNHMLGFYESFDGGLTWPVQGHIPGYEGWTDNTDPIGAFDGYGNYYEFILPYQFYYNGNGSHNFNIGQPQEANPSQAAEVVAVAVRPAGSTTATQWITTHGGHPDFVKTYDSKGNEPDKQWMTIDTNKLLPDGTPNPNYNNVYLMWVDFHFLVPLPFVSVSKALADGTHTDWSAPISLPRAPHSPQGATYLLPHVDPNGVLYTTITNFNPSKGFCCTSIFVDKSSDGGQTWSVAGTAVESAIPPGLIYPNTTFRDGIENTFTVGPRLVGSHYPLYVAYEDFSAGVDNVLLTASYDGGAMWSSPIQVNDNANPVDEFQPNLTTSASGTVSVNFYDRRLACPASGTTEATNAGIALDQTNRNPDYTGPTPPYGAANYCVNASIQFYTPRLGLIAGHEHNIRLTQHTWDPQLNALHPGRPGGEETFIGDYFGNIVDDATATDYSSFVSTFNDGGGNTSHYQQQVVATLAIP